MTRVFSGIVLILAVVGGVWFAPRWGLLLMVEAVLRLLPFLALRL